MLFARCVLVFANMTERRGDFHGAVQIYDASAICYGVSFGDILGFLGVGPLCV